MGKNAFCWASSKKWNTNSIKDIFSIRVTKSWKEPLTSTAVSKWQTALSFATRLSQINTIQQFKHSSVTKKCNSHLCLKSEIHKPFMNDSLLLWIAFQIHCELRSRMVMFTMCNNTTACVNNCSRAVRKQASSVTDLLWIICSHLTSGKAISVIHFSTLVLARNFYKTPLSDGQILPHKCVLLWQKVLF